MFDNKNLIKVSNFLLFSTAFLPFVLWAGFSFPYVTIRISLFRIIIEVVMILSIILLLQGNNLFSRLKQNYFCWIFGGLVFIEFIAGIFGESFLFSFFGDLERMWGIFTVIHLFLFYVLLRAFFKEKEYKIFFHVSFVTSLLVSIYGIIQKYPDFFGIYVFEAGASRIPSTLGNPTYVAIYLLFNITFALYYFLKSKTNIRYFYAIVILIDFIAFSLTDIRGAYLGLILGVGFSSILYLFLGHSRRLKIGVASILSIGIIVIGLSFIFKETSVVRSLPILDRVSTISLTAGTTQTRFIGWSAALNGFKQDPFTGVGMENYNIVFDKYFPAQYYELARTETYFDRAHNQFLNILAESGIFALLVYLCFPLFIAYYLIYGYRKEKFNLNELLIFSALGIAYFVHLFFVFDDINSFLFFVAFLGVIEFTYYKDKLLKQTEDIKKINSLIIIVSIVLIPVLVYSIFAFNFKTLQVAKISASAFSSSKVPSEAISYYDKSLSLGLIASDNIVIAYADYLVSLSDNEEEIKANAQELRSVLIAIDKAKRALEKEIQKKPNDTLLHMKLGYLNNAHYIFDNNIEHLQESIKELKTSIELSPERLQVYYILGESLILDNQNKEAIDVLERAVELNPNFGASYYFLGRAYVVDGQIDKGYDFMINKALVESLFKHTPQDNRLLLYLSETIAKTGDYKKVVEIYKQLIKISPNDVNMLASLAAAYVQIDEFDLAIQTAQKAAILDPSFAPEADYFIQMIQEGKIDELKEATH